MADINKIFNRLIFICGPPRSGTTFAARSLNSHPNIICAIDDHVYECWALYYYPSQEGIIKDLNTSLPSQEEVFRKLKNHLIKNRQFQGIAPSTKTVTYPLSGIPQRMDRDATKQDLKLIRHVMPIIHFRTDWYLCLKSPEISLTLPQLSSYFKNAKFVIVFRPMIEIAESMYRKGNIPKKIPRFHGRWALERNNHGELIPPPSIPDEWFNCWQEASGFQQCLMVAAGYLKALIQGIQQLKKNHFMIYNHNNLKKKPEKVLKKIADFLDINHSGFNPVINELNRQTPSIPPALMAEYHDLQHFLNLESFDQQIKRLESMTLDN